MLALTSTAGLTLATKVAKIFSYDMYWLTQASAVDTIFIITLQDKLSADFKTTAIATPPTLLEVCTLHLHVYVHTRVCVCVCVDSTEKSYYIICLLMHYLIKVNFFLVYNSNSSRV